MVCGQGGPGPCQHAAGLSASGSLPSQGNTRAQPVLPTCCMEQPSTSRSTTLARRRPAKGARRAEALAPPVAWRAWTAWMLWQRATAAMVRSGRNGAECTVRGPPSRPPPLRRRPASATKQMGLGSLNPSGACTCCRTLHCPNNLQRSSRQRAAPPPANAHLQRHKEASLARPLAFQLPRDLCSPRCEQSCGQQRCPWSSHRHAARGEG